MPYIQQTSKNATAGTLVTVVSDCGTAVIVEDGNGKRFSVRAELLGDEPIGEVKTTQTEHPLLESFRKQLSKLGRSKYKALVSAVEDGLIKQEMPKGTSKELWLELSKSIL